MRRMLSCFSAVCRPRKARPRSRARGLLKRETVRPVARPGGAGVSGCLDSVWGGWYLLEWEVR